MYISRPLVRINHWVDHWDHYGYSRLIAVKATYLAIIFFLSNLLIKAPYFPVLTMMVAASAVMIIEMPAMNDHRQKDLVYLGYSIVALLTISLFDLVFYLKVWFIVIASVWCYFLYRMLMRKPQLFTVVSIIMLLALMSLESHPEATLNGVANNLFYFIEFSIIGFWAHKMFPNYYIMIYRKALLATVRSLYSGNSYDASLQHYNAMLNVTSLSSKDDQVNIEKINKRVIRLYYYYNYLHYNSPCWRYMSAYCSNQMVLLRRSLSQGVALNNEVQNGCYGPLMSSQSILLETTQHRVEFNRCCNEIAGLWGELCKRN